MTPNFFDNDLVFLISFFKCKKNDVVAFNFENKTILKRVSFVSKNRITITSDNLDYHSKFNNMIIEKEKILGKVIFKFGSNL